MSPDKYKSLTDLELVDLYRNGRDQQAFGFLFTRYTHLVFGVCLNYLRDRDESKDAVMQIFEKLQSDLFKHSIYNFKSWLHSVARNHCLMELRKRKGVFKRGFDMPGIELKVVEMQSVWHPDPEDLIQKEKTLQQLEAGIKTLNEHQRICIVMFYLEEKSYKEITELTKYSLLEVKSHIQNGKRNLKSYLEKNHAG